MGGRAARGIAAQRDGCADGGAGLVAEQLRVKRSSNAAAGCNDHLSAAVPPPCTPPRYPRHPSPPLTPHPRRWAKSSSQSWMVTQREEARCPQWQPPSHQSHSLARVGGCLAGGWLAGWRGVQCREGTKVSLGWWRRLPVVCSSWLGASHACAGLAAPVCVYMCVCVRGSFG